MRRWTVFWYLLIIYGHTSSQPIEDGENARQTRQLDFERCCPCADESDQAARAVGAGPRTDPDDCPCRPRSADSEGASSVLFPTALRPRTSVVRHDEGKEDTKPLLHPEVDLASSVLQTIREATDEEYKDALAREAARSVARAAIDDIFGDAAPEASNRNSVTIIVKPKEAEDISEESHNHDARCIHAPLESERTVSKMRTAQKPNLFHDIFGLPKASKPGLQHTTLLDMDNGVGASNVDERVLHVDSKSRAASSSTNKEKSPSLHEQLRDFISGKTTLDGKVKTSLPSLPKLKPINSMLNINGGNGDLSSSPSNLEEHVGKLYKNIKVNSHIENILPKARPLDIKNLLKLKDVELIPLKDLINNAKKQPKTAISSRITNEDESLPSDESELNDLLNLVPSSERVRKVEVSDPEVSPSNVIQQVSDDTCNINSGRHTVESEEKLSEFFNTTPSPQFIESDVNDRSSDIDNSQSSELSNNNSELPLSKERPITYEIQEIKRGDSDTGTFDKLRAEDLVDRQGSELNKDNCLDNNRVEDSTNGASNAVNTIVEPDSDKHDFGDTSIARQTQDGHNGIKLLNNKPKPKAFELLDKTMDIMKSNIIENIKSHSSGKSFGKVENQNVDKINDESNQIRSEKIEMDPNESFENVDSSRISMRDLQKMSDSMLQHENKEKTRSNTECDIHSQEIVEPNEATEMKSTDQQESSEEKMQTLQNEDDMNTQSSVNTDVKNTCGSDISQQSKAQEDDTNFGASENIISKIPPRNAVQSIQSSDAERPCDPGMLKNPLDGLSDVLKMPPIPTLDELTSRVTNIFDNGQRSAEDILKADSLVDPSRILEPIMATGASTRNSQSKRPSERLLQDLDILKVQPLSILPKSKWTDNLGLKPFKLESAFDSKGLGSGIGRSRSKNVSRKTSLRKPLHSAGTHNILKSSLNHDDLLNGRALSDLSQNINSHFKSASRNIHNALGSTFDSGKKTPSIQLQPYDLFETIARNHEDVSDTLKALHMDFNDRLDTMRNDLFDKPSILTSESRNRQPSIKSLGDNSLLRSSQPTLIPGLRNTPALGLDLPKLKGSSSSSRTNKFKMPTAASVPVPKTVNVPELKMMSKPSGLAPQRTNSPNIHNIELPRTNFDTLRNHGSNTKPLNVVPLKKPVKPFGDTKVKVSFSTTPRPRQETVKPKTQAKTSLRVTPENHGIKKDQWQTKPLTSTGLLNNHKLLHTDTDSNKRLSTGLGKPVSKLGILGNDRNLGSLHSWPKASEGGFLSKVKEAVKARLPPSNLSSTLKQANVKSTLPRNGDDVTNGTDMSRAASEVVERTDGQVLKENVTYKCKMVCTQE